MSNHIVPSYAYRYVINHDNRRYGKPVLHLLDCRYAKDWQSHSNKWQLAQTVPEDVHICSVCEREGL